jgi:hypothetical protein
VSVVREANLLLQEEGSFIGGFYDVQEVRVSSDYKNDRWIKDKRAIFRHQGP